MNRRGATKNRINYAKPDDDKVSSSGCGCVSTFAGVYMLHIPTNDAVTINSIINTEVLPNILERHKRSIKDFIGKNLILLPENVAQDIAKCLSLSPTP